MDWATVRTSAIPASLAETDGDHAAGTSASPAPAVNRLHALANYARFLTANPAPGPVARALVLGALAPLNCSAAFVFETQRSSGQTHDVLHVLSTYGASEGEIATFSMLPIDLPLPVTESVSTGRVLVTEGAQVVSLFPLLQAPDVRAVLPERVQTSTIVCMPFIWQGIPVGACSLFAAPEAVRGMDDLEYLQAVADVSALWLAARGVAPDAHEGSPTPLLTQRQREILRLIAQGCTNIQIAAHLGYSVPTIKKDVQRIMALCGVRTRRDVPARAEKFGLL